MPQKTLQASSGSPFKISMPEVMSWIQQVIHETEVPSWLNSVPHNYSDAKASVVKADEWQNLSTIFLPITIICLWDEGTSHPLPAITARVHCILDHTMLLVSVVSLTCMHTMTPGHSAAYLEYMTQYIHDFLHIHVDIKPCPNMHMAMHIPHFYTFLALFDLGGVFLSNSSLVRSRDYSVMINLVFWFCALSVVSKFLTCLIQVKWNQHYFTPFSGLAIWNAGQPNQTVPL